jgi:type III pantothenate kinase
VDALDRIQPPADSRLTLDPTTARREHAALSAMQLILVVDIGNTSSSLACYAAGRVFRVQRIATSRSAPAAIKRLAREALAGRAARGAMVASVVTRVDRIWRAALESVIDGPVAFVTHRLRLGVPLCYPKPASIGADRLANACGGADRYGVPLIVADFGTAVTFDIITRRGYEGGVIAPGLPLVFEYLAEKTAKLPRIREGAARGPWGRSTEQAMRLGARWGYPALVRGILAELRRHPALRAARLVITGGHGRIVARAIEESAVVDPTLTLYGVGRIYELNIGSRA